MIFKHIVRWLVILLAAASAVELAVMQNSGLIIENHQVDDSRYPEIQVYFTPFSSQTGRIFSLSETMLSATYNNQRVDIVSLMENPAENRPIHLVIGFDLTSSQNTDFLNAQKETAYALIDALDEGDSVGIITFDTDSADMAVDLKPDINAALNFVDTVQIIQGPSNRFYDGVYAAVNALTNREEQGARRAVVIMTDVQQPQGSATIDSAVNLANQLNAPIFLIGYNDAVQDVLMPYSQPTGGFTYMQREIEALENVTLERMAQDIAETITTEYRVDLHATSPANDSPAPLELTINAGSANPLTTFDVTAHRRGISITFPRLSGEPVSDSVTFEPLIAYADSTGVPQIVEAAYYVENGSLNNETLRPPDTANPIYTWDIRQVAGGSYTLRLEVTDDVGNEGSQTFAIQVASPIAVNFVQPAASADVEEPVLVPQGSSTVVVAIEGSYPVNEVELFIDGQSVGMMQPMSDGTYALNWDTSELAGIYTLQVQASDMRANNAQATLPVQVSIGAVAPPVTLLILAGVVALLVLGAVMLTLSRRRAAVVNNIPSPNLMTPPIPGESYESRSAPIAKLRVLRNSADGIADYKLQQGMVSVGRSRSNPIRVAGRSASRQHAEISSDDGYQFLWRDCIPGRNPTTINGQMIQGSHLLQEGDRIVVGETEFMFTFH